MRIHGQGVHRLHHRRHRGGSPWSPRIGRKAERDPAALTERAVAEIIRDQPADTIFTLGVENTIEDEHGDPYGNEVVTLHHIVAAISQGGVQTPAKLVTREAWKTIWEPR
ncbi:MAG: hypothetical protein ACRBN8_44335 [Nannocystales bacterium]